MGRRPERAGMYGGACAMPGNGTLSLPGTLRTGGKLFLVRSEKSSWLAHVPFFGAARRSDWPLTVAADFGRLTIGPPGRKRSALL